MNLPNPVFLVPALVAFCLFSVGLVMFKFPPKNINDCYGYRTPKSMASENRWAFAQHYSARQCITWGLVFTVLSVIGLFAELGNVINVIMALAITILCALIPIINTEKAIKRQFGQV